LRVRASFASFLTDNGESAIHLRLFDLVVAFRFGHSLSFSAATFLWMISLTSAINLEM
jgi:hypothetical protein